MELETPIDILIFNKLDIFYKRLIKQFIKQEIKDKLYNNIYPIWFFKGSYSVDLSDVIRLLKLEDTEIIRLNIRNMLIDNLPKYTTVKIKLIKLDSYLYTYKILYTIILSTQIYDETYAIHNMTCSDYVYNTNNKIIENDIGNTKILLHLLDNIILPQFIKHIESKIFFYSNKYNSLQFTFNDTEFIDAHLINYISTSLYFDNNKNMIYGKDGYYTGSAQTWIFNRLYKMTKDNLYDKNIKMNYIVDMNNSFMLSNLFCCIFRGKQYIKNNTVIKIIS
jgi:hypothetical protein